MSKQPHQLSEAAARRVMPNTFRCGLQRNAKGVANAVAMHVTFADEKEQPLILLYAVQVVPSIIAQLQEILEAATPLAPRPEDASRHA